MRIFLETVVRLGAGVGIFLYGLHLISACLEDLAGPAVERGLQRLTANPWIGALTQLVIFARV